MSKITDNAKYVVDRESFVRFAQALSSDFVDNKGNWGNQDIATFLSALGDWIEDMDGYYENQNLEVPKNINWAFLRDALMAARVYE